MSRPVQTMNETNMQGNQKAEAVKTVWQSAWCSVGSEGPQVQARVGKSSAGFHAGVATSGETPTVTWGPGTPDEKSARMIAQSATAQALTKRSAAQEFGGPARTNPPTQGRSR